MVSYPYIFTRVSFYLRFKWLPFKKFIKVSDITKHQCLDEGMCHPDAIVLKELSPEVLEEIDEEFKKHENENTSKYALKINEFLHGVSSKL